MRAARCGDGMRTADDAIASAQAEAGYSRGRGARGRGQWLVGQQGRKEAKEG